MSNDIINAIYEVYPNNKLKESLLFEDYEKALEILDEFLITYEPIQSQFTIFDMLLEGIRKKDKEKIMKVIMICERPFFVNAARNVILHQSLYKSNVEKYEQIANSEMDFYFKYVGFLNRYKEIVDIDFDNFCTNLFKNKSKKYKKVEALKLVFAMKNTASEDEYTIGRFVEGLIEGGEITFETIIISVLDNNPDLLMEQFLTIKFLRETYYVLRVDEIKEKKALLDSVLNYGLKRKKTYSSE